MNGISPVESQSPPVDCVSAFQSAEANHGLPVDLALLKIREQRRKWKKTWMAKNGEKYKRWQRDYNKRPEVKAKDRARNTLEHRRAKNRTAKSYERHRRWREKNRESQIAKQRLFYHQNRERLLAQKRATPPDKEHRKRYLKAWVLRNHSKTVQYRIKRKNLLAGATVRPELIDAFIIKTRQKKFARCYYCRVRIHTSSIEFDHVVALSVGGAHSIENLCIACFHCNRRKNKRRIGEWERLGQQLFDL